MDKNLFIAPISIDLGAAHTGVYSAFYKAGSKPCKIERSGTVYNLEKDKYTLLMAQRTARRHQRRGFDRRQMAKRLLKLIWTEHFKLEWNNDVAQTIGFLMNRRGFSFLSEEYNKEALLNFPLEVWEKLPSEFRESIDQDEVEVNETVSFGMFLQRISDDQKKCKKYLNLLCSPSKKIKKELLYYGRTKNLKDYCQAVRDKIKVQALEKKGKKLERLSLWIVEEWKKEGIQGFEKINEDNNWINIVEFIKNNPEIIDLILGTIPDYSGKEKEKKDSIWNFNESNCDIEKLNFADSTAKDYQKSHIHNLAYALFKINTELESGGRHRKRYFEEVNAVLSRKNHVHGYLKYFCSKLQNGKFHGLSPDKLKNLIGHISNLELKPLRKYFNSEEHKAGDKWDENRLEKYFENWILREWRVNLNVDKDKQRGKPQDYQALKDSWKNNKNSVVDFWLKENPVSTIPPYQDNNNRRPPRCQSLILNVDFLNRKYPNWKEWLSLLVNEQTTTDYLGNFKEQFINLKSGKGFSYFTDKFTGVLSKDSQKRSMADLDARILHFILDRSKKTDPFKLNEIYSITKKIRQLKQDAKKDDLIQEKLKEIIEKSSLPASLKTQPDFNQDDVFEDRTFFHFICKYFKTRQRARDGRIYIHPEYKKTEKRGFETTTRFDSDNKLLTYCNHKPRQKRYQMFHDLAGVFQIKPAELKNKIDSREEQQILEWIKDFKIETHCRNCATAQKEFRGELKFILNSGKNKNLNKLREASIKFSRKIGEKLFLDDAETKSEKFESIFSFAQIYNIIFADRGGNSNTCPICSVENSNRMENIKYSDGGEGAKAQRLPAIPTRLIDGAVMRMARIISKQIVEDQWNNIYHSLKENKRVRIPIITESNRFEFEPALAKIKGKAPKSGQAESALKNKEERIRKMSEGICPYSGINLGDGGELDHIIPRSSKWGTLNDEANLIYVSRKGNTEKGELFFTLSNLNNVYKNNLFKTSDDREIESFIKKTIWDDVRKTFLFGKYNSFINLKPEEQKAFRHALFLKNNHPIKIAVIRAIDNRNRAFVNGTQRYFAEVLANEFFKKAKLIGKERFLDFDYFGVEAVTGTRGDGIKELRALYEFMDDDIAKYSKKIGEKQKFYSHLMDAHMAFLRVADEHRGEGSLRLDIDEDRGLFPFNKETGEVYIDNLFTDTWVQPDSSKFTIFDLKRRKPQEGFTQHRSFTRDSFYADHYLPLLITKIKDDQIINKIGFSVENSVVWKTDKKSLSLWVKLLPFFKQRNYYSSEIPHELSSLTELFDWLTKSDFFKKQMNQSGFIHLSFDKEALHEYWRKEHNTLNGNSKGDVFDFCYQKVGYRTENRKLILEGKNNLYDTLEEENLFTIKVLGKSVNLPQKNEWLKLKEKWEDVKKEKMNEDFDFFLRAYFMKGQQDPHQKVRKVFSLPVPTSLGHFLLCRTGWNGVRTYQIVSDSESRTVENKPISPVLSPNGKIEGSLASWAKSANFVKLANEKFSSDTPVDTSKWFEINGNTEIEPVNLPIGVEKAWLRIDDKTAPSVALKFSKDPIDLNSDILKDKILEHGFRPQKAKSARGNNPAIPAKSADDVMQDFWNNVISKLKTGDIVEFKGSKQYGKKRQDALKTAILVDYLE